MLKNIKKAAIVKTNPKDKGKKIFQPKRISWS